MKYIKFLSILCSIGLMISCGSSTKVTSSWKAEGAASNSTSLKKIMVVALLPEKDRNLQQVMEKGLVDKLAEKNIQAFSAYQQYGPNSISRNERQALKRIKKSGVDGVITIVLLDKQKERDYVPGNVMARPYGFYYNRFWGYYTTVYDRVYTPGYYETNTNYFFESNLYSLNADKLLYSAQTESFDPSSTERLAKEYSKSIVEDMSKGGVLVAGR
ncbi:MAG: hypothetical protein INR73_14380 [Williamsia sp.]|nr:hypothetical protein [Williamsia sp.]